MPELPEVEIVKRSLEDKIVNQTIVDIDVRFEKLIKRQKIETFLDRLEGFTFRSLERRGKYLIFHGDKGGHTYHMINHLGMTGAWFYVKNSDEIIEEYRNHRHILFLLSDKHFLIYCDIRKFGRTTVFTNEEYNTFKPIQEMGPEPFSKNGLEVFLENIRHNKWSNKPIKSVMLEQKIIAGVGNIYINEALFLLGIHPETSVGILTDDILTQLFHTLVKLFERSIQMGGSSISDYVDSEGNKGNFQQTFKIYQKKRCGVCGEDVRRIEVAKRSTFYCPVCQKKKGW